MSDLRILITAKLNESISSKQLQEDLDRISSNLKVNIGIDTQQMGNINKQISELQKQVQGLTGKGIRIIDDKDAIENINKGKQGVRELYTDIDRAVTRYSQFGTVSFDKVLHPVTKDLQGFNMQIERGNGLVDKLKLDLVKLGDVNGTSGFEVVARKQMDNTQKLAEQQLQQRTQVNQKIEKQNEASLQKRAQLEQSVDQRWQKMLHDRGIKETQQIDQIASKRSMAERKTLDEKLRLEKAQAQAINKQLDDKWKQQQQEKQKTVELQKQLQLYRQQASLNAQNIRRTHGTTVDNKSLQEYQRNVRSLTATTPNLTHRMRELDMEFKKIRGSAMTAAGALQQSGMGMAEMLRTAMIKFPVWMLSATLFYQPIRQGRELVNTLIEINTQMTTLGRVTAGEANIEKTLRSSFEIADRLGSKLEEINEAVIGFARQGFRDEELSSMAEVATLMSNVSTLSLEEAMSKLTAAVKVFNIEATESVRVVDSLNEVDNNFAISYSRPYW